MFASICSCSITDIETSATSPDTFSIETQTAISKKTDDALDHVKVQTQQSHQSATQTEIASRKTLSALPTSTSTSTSTPIVTPTLQIIDGWKIFRQEDLGFEFEFPAAYGEGDYLECRIFTRDDPDEYYFRLGARIELLVSVTEEVNLDDYVTSYIDEESQFGDWEVFNQEYLEIGSQQATTIEYQFGMLGRYGTSTFILKDGRIYHFNYSAGVDCSYPGTISELSVYFDILESFRFLSLDTSE
jgi:hypothetical protein